MFAGAVNLIDATPISGWTVTGATLTSMFDMGATTSATPNNALQKASGRMSPKKLDADEKLVEKVMEYLQGMAEVKAYHLTGQKSGELNDAIAENVKINTDMEMTLIPRMTAQTFIAKLTGVAMTALSCALFVAGKMDALSEWVLPETI